jgi:hypothetical protein
MTINRLFGFPPQNATYVCVWEIRLGQIVGSPSTSFLTALGATVTSFMTSLRDVLDSIAEEFRIVFEPDITFIKIVVDSIELTWSLPDAALRLLLSSGLRFDSNDLPGANYKNVKSLVMPNVQIQSLLVRRYAGRRAEEWFEVGCGSFDVSTDIYSAPPGWQNEALHQKQFVETQDFATRRVAWIYSAEMQKGLHIIWNAHISASHYDSP